MNKLCKNTKAKHVLLGTQFSTGKDHLMNTLPEPQNLVPSTPQQCGPCSQWLPHGHCLVVIPTCHSPTECCHSQLLINPPGILPRLIPNHGAWHPLPLGWQGQCLEHLQANSVLHRTAHPPWCLIQLLLIQLVHGGKNMALTKRNLVICEN